jgi:hypothetical protein
MTHPSLIKVLTSFIWLVDFAFAETTVSSVQELRTATERGDQYVIVGSHLDLSSEADGASIIHSKRFNEDRNAFLVIRVRCTAHGDASAFVPVVHSCVGPRDAVRPSYTTLDLSCVHFAKHTCMIVRWRALRSQHARPQNTLGSSASFGCRHRFGAACPPNVGIVMRSTNPITVGTSSLHSLDMICYFHRAMSSQTVD